MQVRDLVTKLLQYPMEAEVVLDTDDTMDKNYKAVNNTSLAQGGFDNFIVILEHRW